MEALIGRSPFGGQIFHCHVWLPEGNSYRMQNMSAYEGFLKWGYLQIIYLNGFFHFKTTILGSPIYEDPMKPHETPIYIYPCIDPLLQRLFCKWTVMVCTSKAPPMYANAWKPAGISMFGLFSYVHGFSAHGDVQAVYGNIYGDWVMSENHHQP